MSFVKGKKSSKCNGCKQSPLLLKCLSWHAYLPNCSMSNPSLFIECLLHSGIPFGSLNAINPISYYPNFYVWGIFNDLKFKSISFISIFVKENEFFILLLTQNSIFLNLQQSNSFSPASEIWNEYYRQKANSFSASKSSMQMPPYVKFYVVSCQMYFLIDKLLSLPCKHQTCLCIDQSNYRGRSTCPQLQGEYCHYTKKWIQQCRRRRL